MQKETGWRTDDGRIYNNISILFPTIVQISPTPDFLSQRGEGGGIITTDNDNYMRSCHLGTLSNHHATISYSSTLRIPIFLGCFRSHSSSPSRSFAYRDGIYSQLFVYNGQVWSFERQLRRGYPTLSKTYPLTCSVVFTINVVVWKPIAEALYIFISILYSLKYEPVWNINRLITNDEDDPYFFFLQSLSFSICFIYRRRQIVY